MRNRQGFKYLFSPLYVIPLNFILHFISTPNPFPYDNLGLYPIPTLTLTRLHTPRGLHFLENLNLPILSTQDRDQVEKPVALEEFHNAARLLKKGQSPGLDGRS